MTETIEYEQFEGASQPGPGASGEVDLARLSDVPMELSVEIGRSHMTVGEVLELRVGAVLRLERAAGAPVDLLVNGTPIARGEVVVVDEQYGLRVSEILDSREDSGALDGAVADDGAGAASAEDPNQAEV